jgi:precorrin-3B synthase
MNLPSFSRKGWCPGALSPMQARDGMLLRLRLSCGVLTAANASQLADCGRLYGNGTFDLSARGNLQMRGIRQEALPELHLKLDRLGLLDSSPDAEAVRNVLVSPLHGFNKKIDIAPLAKALEAALIETKELHRLPGKFGFLIDDGTQPSLLETAADVRFMYSEAQARFNIAIAGNSATAIDLGSCPSQELISVAKRLAFAFLEFKPENPECTRMRDLVTLIGARQIAKAAGLEMTLAENPSPLADPSPIGSLRIGETDILGIGVPFGRLNSAMLQAAARVSAEFGTGEMRLTPWRAMLIPGIAHAQHSELRDHFSGLNFITRSDDPLLKFAACSGQSACEQATTETQKDSLALLDLVTPSPLSIFIHVSGCAKGCAHPEATPFTLVGNAGRYDLIKNGTARDTPFVQGLDLAEAKAILKDEIKQWNSHER